MNNKNMMGRGISKIAIAAIALLGVVSCEEDVTTIGSGFIDGNNINIQLDDSWDVKSYMELLDPVQTSELPTYRLGAYVDPVFGTTKNHIISQLELPGNNPMFGDNAVIDSVILNIPYFATREDIQDDGTNIYSLDSVYGSEPFRLEVYESQFYLSDIDPNELTEQKLYYSDIQNDIESNLGPLLFAIDDFQPSGEEVQLYSENTDGEMVITSRVTPRLRVPLDNTYWTQKILDQEGTTSLLNNNEWKFFFRGLYFKTGNIIGAGNMAALNLDQANVTIHYSFTRVDIGDDDGDGDFTDTIDLNSTFVLSFDGNVVNAYENNYDPTIIATVNASNNTTGDEKIYLKGGQGTLAIVELFGEDADGDMEADQLTQLKANNWLINEANLIFYVDQSEVQGGDSEPERILIYNIDNEAVLLDYILDPTTAEGARSVDSKRGHLGRLERDEMENGVRYKIRITEHIRNIVQNDSTNVRLGLGVSQNVNLVELSDVQGTGEIENVSKGSVISHESTVLHGNLSTDVDKRLRLRIYYSDPE